MQTSIFVDAGYLHAQGSALLAGQKQPRSLVVLDVDKVMAALRSLAFRCAPGERLLRIYWYDGLPRSGRLNAEQEQVAGAQLTKLRLGVVNSQGDQKGVDSLIVTDLIELARNRAITSALLVSGDEDIRVGVQIAQTFGVQLHLLGIKPARGSQSPDLIREADTHTEWDETVVADLMTIRQPLEVQLPPVASPPVANAQAMQPSAMDLSSAVKICIDDTIDSLDQISLDSALRAFKVNPSSVPPELDRPALGRLRSILKRELSDEERKQYRAQFRAELASL